MKKPILKLYDRLILGILFSAFLGVSCKPDEPVPAYGVAPMYGVQATTVIAIQHTSQTNPHPLK